MADTADPVRALASRRWVEVAKVFLVLGSVGFGGPAAHIALMRSELVQRRHWLDDEDFLALVGATNLIPGPNSTELAIHLGQRRAGWRGLLAAGFCFIGPAVVIVSFLAWLYERYGTDPAIIDLRYGVLPVVVAVVIHAVVGLTRSAVRSVLEAAVALAAFAAFLVGAHELLILLAAGGATAAWSMRSRLDRPNVMAILAGLPLLAEAERSEPVNSWRLFWVFLEIGSVLYGSGYVLLAFLQRLLVDEYGWLSTQQILDGVAIGQVTPGPVFTTATFVGWQIDGPMGAAIATVGIFLPSFVFVALLARIVAWMQTRPTAKAFLRGVTAGSLGLMAAVLVDLIEVAATDAVSVAAIVVSVVVLVRTNLNSAWLMAAGVGLGLVHALAR